MFKKKDPYAGGREVYKRLNATKIKYTAARQPDGSERVLGKEGAVVVTDEKVLLLGGGKVVFSCRKKGLKCGELLSGDGAVFEGIDIDSGETMTVTAYFTSYLKIH